MDECSRADLDEIFDEIFEEIQNDISPITSESKDIEIRMLEGKPYGQLLLAVPKPKDF